MAGMYKMDIKPIVDFPKRSFKSFNYGRCLKQPIQTQIWAQEKKRHQHKGDI